MDHYILIGGQPVHEPDPIRYVLWSMTADRTVARTQVSPAVVVSTVFLGRNPSFLAGRPEFFETMIRGGPHHEATWRYETIEEARVGHEEAVRVASDESHETL